MIIINKKYGDWKMCKQEKLTAAEDDFQPTADIVGETVKCAESPDSGGPTADAASDKKAFAKETFIEFIKSLITGVFPTLTDLLFSNLILFCFFAKAAGIDYFTLLFTTVEAPSDVSAAATAVGYGLGAVVTYLFSIFVVFKHTKKAKSLKGILIFIAIEAFAYGFNVFLGWAFASVPIYFVAFALRIVVSYVVVFSLRKFFIFMPEKKKAADTEADEAAECCQSETSGEDN